MQSDPTPLPDGPGPVGPIRHHDRHLPAWANGLFALASLYLFLCAINLMGAGLKDLGGETPWLHNLLAHANNPFVALMGSVLITAIVQSSSFTTSLIITLVAAGQMQVDDAVYAVMGANIGTSVTNIIVALGNIRIRRQFRRAFTAALVHDIFNWLTVLLLFPLEWITSAFLGGRGWLTRSAEWLTSLIGLDAGEKPLNPVKEATSPVVHALESLSGAIGPTPLFDAILAAILGLVLLFIGLIFLVRNLRGALLRHMEMLFRKIFFRNDISAYTVGVVMTVLVQSSSVTTSLIVPLAGAGIVKLKRVYPYTLGANLGTTLTGVLAATATDNLALAVPVAVSHVLFNMIGTSIWYPLKIVPMETARWYGRLASKSRRYAFLFLLLVFVVVPLIGLIITELLT